MPTTETRTEVTVALSTVVITEVTDVLPAVETAVPETEPVETAPVVPDLVVEETTGTTGPVGVETTLPGEHMTSTPCHEMSFEGPPASPIMGSPVKPSTFTTIPEPTTTTTSKSKQIEAPVKPGPIVVLMTRKSARKPRAVARLFDEVMERQVEESLSRRLAEARGRQQRRQPLACDTTIGKLYLTLFAILNPLTMISINYT